MKELAVVVPLSNIKTHFVDNYFCGW